MSEKNSTIVTRFAPSPTGFLHIGGARTALFNWLFARNQGGKFLLRIEDTDRARSTDEAIKAILKGLAWLGLDADVEPIYQHKQCARHISMAHLLLEQGHAYKCTCTQKELNAIREAAQKARQPIRYDGRCRNKQTLKSDAPYVIRFKAPVEGITTIKDKIQGTVSVKNDQLDDLILLRSDQTPTYMLCVVVDDHDMGITHIIRGDDHLTNAVRQKQLYEALGWDIPQFAHIPLIHGADGAKLSKRHGALGVEAYAEMGFLAAGMRNYLARLGWSHGDDELFSTQELIACFNLEGIGKSPARFDFDKLAHVNAYHIRQASDDALRTQTLKRYPELSPHQESFTRALPFIKEKAKSLDELVAQTEFLRVTVPIKIEEKLQNALDTQRLNLLSALLPLLVDIPKWDKQSLEACLDAFMEVHNIKMGRIGFALRACLTGTVKSPALYDVLVLLGKQETIGRISAQIEQSDI